MAVVIKVEDVMNGECDSVRIWEVGEIGKDDIQSMGVYMRIQGCDCCGHREGERVRVAIGIVVSWPLSEPRGQHDAMAQRQQDGPTIVGELRKKRYTPRRKGPACLDCHVGNA